MSLKTTKSNKGITLIALIITIIVLLILAVVSIGAIREGGIITHAENASTNYNAEQEKEKVTLAVSEALLANNGAIKKADLVTALDKQFGAGNYTISEGEEAPFKVTITNGTGTEYTIQANGSITTSNENNTGDKDTVDGVAIPTGFHHVTGDTKEAGIVVADESGNEYVWVPVTKDENGNPTEPYASANGKMTTTKGEVEIQLQRSGFGMSITSHKEENATEHTYGNAIAKDIEKFKESVSKNGGYFIGRYEAGTTVETPTSTSNTNSDPNWTGYTGGELVVKQGAQVWNYITQNKASELCKNIDSNYTGITSDLVNSYAWDTAIVFIQKCGTNSNYANQTGKSTTPAELSKTGEAILESTGQVDVQCNIYDMAGNCFEWTTETSSRSNYPCVYRGGRYSSSYNYTSSRISNSVTYAYSNYSFRPLLYW